MKEMYDIVALGELLVDFTHCGRSENGMRLFEQNPGGAPANVLCELANFGLKTALIGKVGDDMHGDFLVKTLKEKRVDTRGIIRDGNVFTTLAFVELSDAGERKFSFARKPGADICLSSSEIDHELLSNCKVFHFGSLSLTDEPSRTATMEAVKLSKQAGAIISYDPNYRASLWKSKDEAAARMRSVLDFVDVIKISDEEMGLLTGEETPEAAAACLIGQGIPCVVITLDSEGAYAAAGEGGVFVPGLHAPATDTTGAGDAFWGGFLYKLIRSGRRTNELGKAELEEFTAFANAAASVCIQRRGGIPAMPTLDEVSVLLK